MVTDHVQHDKTNGPASCAPGGDFGNFIMFERATDGDLSNNDDFSTGGTRSADKQTILSILDTALAIIGEDDLEGLFEDMPRQ